MEQLSKWIYKYRYIFYFLALVPMFITRDFTRNNELRYLSIADEAIRNGNIFTFTNHGLFYADKPPLYLWIVMAGKLLFGTHSMFFLALFSYIPALVVIWTMNRWTRASAPKGDRVAGELMLLTSVFFIGSAVVLRMDMLMCMFITLSLYTFDRMYSSRHGGNHSGRGEKWDKWMFPVYIFLAVFSKGPVGIMVPLMTTIVFLVVKRDWRSIWRFWGGRTLGVLIALCSIWFLGAYAEGGSEYLNNLLFNQTINRAVDSFHHKEPVWYYLIAIWYSLAPWVFLIVGLIATGFAKRLVKTDMERIFLIASLGTFVMMSLVSSKIQVYLLPSFPFFVWITVLWLGKLSRSVVARVGMLIPSIILLLALPGAIVAGKMELFPVFESVWIVAASAVLSISGIIAIWYLTGERWSRSYGEQNSTNSLQRSIVTVGVGMLLAIFTISFYVPQYNPELGMSAVSEVAREMATKTGTQKYYVYDISRAENADVFLGSIPESVSIEKIKVIIEGDERGVLIFMQSSLEEVPELATLLEGRELRASGYFFCVVL